MRRRKKNECAVFFVHGLFSNYSHHIFFNLRKELGTLNYPCFEFEQYSNQNRGEKVRYPDFQGLTAGLQEMICELRTKFKKVFIVSHSVGFYIAAGISNELVDGQIFVEPSIHPKEIFSRFSRKGNFCELDSGYIIKLDQDVIDKVIKIQSPEEYARKLTVPTIVIAAQKGSLATANLVFSNLRHKKHIKIFKRTSHNFDEIDSEAGLIDSVKKFIIQYGSHK